MTSRTTRADHGRMSSLMAALGVQDVHDAMAAAPEALAAPRRHFGQPHKRGRGSRRGKGTDVSYADAAAPFGQHLAPQPHAPASHRPTHGHGTYHSHRRVRGRKAASQAALPTRAAAGGVGVKSEAAVRPAQPTGKAHPIAESSAAGGASGRARGPKRSQSQPLDVAPSPVPIMPWHVDESADTRLAIRMRHAHAANKAAATAEVERRLAEEAAAAVEDAEREMQAALRAASKGKRGRHRVRTKRSKGKGSDGQVPAPQHDGGPTQGEASHSSPSRRDLSPASRLPTATARHAVPMSPLAVAGSRTPKVRMVGTPEAILQLDVDQHLKAHPAVVNVPGAGRPVTAKSPTRERLLTAQDPAISGAGGDGGATTAVGGLTVDTRARGAAVAATVLPQSPLARGPQTDSPRAVGGGTVSHTRVRARAETRARDAHVGSGTQPSGSPRHGDATDPPGASPTTAVATAQARVSDAAHAYLSEVQRLIESKGNGATSLTADPDAKLSPRAIAAKLGLDMPGLGSGGFLDASTVPHPGLDAYSMPAPTDDRPGAASKSALAAREDLPYFTPRRTGVMEPGQPLPPSLIPHRYHKAQWVPSFAPWAMKKDGLQFNRSTQRWERITFPSAKPGDREEAVLLAHTADLMLAEVYAADEGAPPDAVGPDASRLTAASAVADASASVLPADRLHRAHARAKRKSAEANAAAGVLASLDEAEHAGPAAQRLASLLRSRAVDFSQQVNFSSYPLHSPWPPKFRQELGVWEAVMVELVRQIGTACEERGALLDKARERLFHALSWADRAMGWMMQVRGYQQSSVDQDMAALETAMGHRLRAKEREVVELLDRLHTLTEDLDVLRSIRGRERLQKERERKEQEARKAARKDVACGSDHATALLRKVRDVGSQKHFPVLLLAPGCRPLRRKLPRHWQRAQYEGYSGLADDETADLAVTVEADSDGDVGGDGGGLEQVRRMEDHVPKDPTLEEAPAAVRPGQEIEMMGARRSIGVNTQGYVQSGWDLLASQLKFGRRPSGVFGAATAEVDVGPGAGAGGVTLAFSAGAGGVDGSGDRGKKGAGKSKKPKRRRKRRKTPIGFYTSHIVVPGQDGQSGAPHPCSCQCTCGAGNGSLQQTSPRGVEWRGADSYSSDSDSVAGASAVFGSAGSASDSTQSSTSDLHAMTPRGLQKLRRRRRHDLARRGKGSPTSKVHSTSAFVVPKRWAKLLRRGKRGKGSGDDASAMSPRQIAMLVLQVLQAKATAVSEARALAPEDVPRERSGSTAAFVCNFLLLKFGTTPLVRARLSKYVCEARGCACLCCARSPPPLPPWVPVLTAGGGSLIEGMKRYRGNNLAGYLATRLFGAVNALPSHMVDWLVRLLDDAFEGDMPPPAALDTRRRGSLLSLPRSTALTALARAARHIVNADFTTAERRIRLLRNVAPRDVVPGADAIAPPSPLRRPQTSASTGSASEPKSRVPWYLRLLAEDERKNLRAASASLVTPADSGRGAAATALAVAATSLRAGKALAHKAAEARNRVIDEAVRDAVEAAVSEGGSLVQVAQTAVVRVVGLLQVYWEVPGDSTTPSHATQRSEHYAAIMRNVPPHALAAAQEAGVEAACHMCATSTWQRTPEEVAGQAARVTSRVLALHLHAAAAEAEAAEAAAAAAKVGIATASPPTADGAAATTVTGTAGPGEGSEEAASQVLNERAAAEQAAVRVLHDAARRIQAAVRGKFARTRCYVLAAARLSAELRTRHHDQVDALQVVFIAMRMWEQAQARTRMDLRTIFMRSDMDGNGIMEFSEFRPIVGELVKMAARPPVGLRAVRAQSPDSPRRAPAAPLLRGQSHGSSVTALTTASHASSHTSRSRAERGGLTLQRMWFDMLNALPDATVSVTVDAFVRVAGSPRYLSKLQQMARQPEWARPASRLSAGSSRSVDASGDAAHQAGAAADAVLHAAEHIHTHEHDGEQAGAAQAVDDSEGGANQD